MRDRIILSKDMDGCQKARLYHDFVILLLFTTVSPSRNADLMKLKILFDEEKQSVSENLILFKENGSTAMIVNKGAIEWTSPVTLCKLTSTLIC